MISTFDEVRKIADAWINNKASDEDIINVQDFCESYLENYHYLPDDIYEFYEQLI